MVEPSQPIKQRRMSQDPSKILEGRVNDIVIA